MSAYRIAVSVYLLSMLALPTAWVVAQTKAKPPIRRATPPKFTKSDPFFADAFSDALNGERPANLGKAVTAKPVPGTSPSPAETAGPSGSGAGWAVIISGTTLEDEIKAQKLAADKNITTPSDFQGKGYEKARRDFSMVAMIFGIIAEYDGEVRWKKEAASERDLFARTASNAKVGTQGVYNEAKLRKQDLADLIGGQAVEIKEAEPKAKWGELVNRSPLMERLELGRDEKIKPWSSSATEFTANLDELAHEAQIFAAIAQVLKADDMESGDDAEYEAFANMLLQGGNDLAQACREKNHDAAGKAVTLIVNSCEKCHEGYR